MKTGIIAWEYVDVRAALSYKFGRRLHCDCGDTHGDRTAGHPWNRDRVCEVQFSMHPNSQGILRRQDRLSELRCFVDPSSGRLRETIETGRCAQTAIFARRQNRLNPTRNSAATAEQIENRPARAGPRFATLTRESSHGVCSSANSAGILH